MVMWKRMDESVPCAGSSCNPQRTTASQHSAARPVGPVDLQGVDRDDAVHRTKGVAH